MTGYFFTKATQCSLFKKFRKIILNLNYDDPSSCIPKGSQECDGLNNGHTANVVHNENVPGLDPIHESLNTNQEKIPTVS